MTNKYNYREAVLTDVKEALKGYDFTQYEDEQEAYDAIYDDMWIDDSVTGNASGSYFCNAWKAEECLTHNWDEIVDASVEYGIEPFITNGYEHGAEWWDVTIRCRYLSECLSEAIEEHFC